jgi:hypothetical protein
VAEFWLRGGRGWDGTNRVVYRSWMKHGTGIEDLDEDPPVLRSVNSSGSCVY